MSVFRRHEEIQLFPHFHASNRFKSKTNWAAFVGWTKRRVASVRHSELRPPFCGDCVSQKCSKRCRLHSMHADADANVNQT